ALATGRRPAMLELLDAPTLRAVQAFRDNGLDASAGAVLLMQSDRGTRAAADLAAFGAAVRECGATDFTPADDATESAMLLEIRRLVMPALERIGTLLIDDVCVPRSALADLVAGVAAIGDEHDVLMTCSGHAGDGNMHPTVIFDGADPAATTRAETAFDAVMRLGLRLGGTITGEHGVGHLKRRWLAEEIGPLGVRLHSGIKSVFDPNGILNPGKVLDRPTRPVAARR
ncbi:MAG: FAD-linked oxidase C-terminal domain-containing protein, partial [Actinomycetes bacterium]